MVTDLWWTAGRKTDRLVSEDRIRASVNSQAAHSYVILANIVASRWFLKGCCDAYDNTFDA
jgi:hypothetical protein